MSGSAPPIAAELRALRAVLAVADTGSTAAAAQALHLSQPATARAVQKIESLLAQPLFERLPRGMRATPAGVLLAGRMRRALAQLPGRLAAMATASQLQVLLAFEGAASERQAADALGVSQPAVHQALRQLEHLAGGALFERSRQGLAFTAPGRALLAQAKRAMAELRGAHEDLQAAAGAVRGRVVVGTLPYWGGPFLPRALQQLTSEHPGVQVTVVDGTYPSLLGQLRQADIDVLVGALRDPPPAGALVQVPLFDDPLAVVVRAGHPLAARAPRRLRQLKDAQWLLPMPGAPARVALEQAFQADGLAPPTQGLQINSTALLQSMLLESDRLALMSPRQLERELAAGLLAVLPVKMAHAPRTIGLTLRADFEPPAPMRFLLQALRHAAGTA